MCGIFIICAFTGLLILSFFMDNIKINSESKKQFNYLSFIIFLIKVNLSIKSQMLETILMFKDMKTWALLPLVALHPLV